MIGLDSIPFMSLIITTVMVIVSYLVMGLFGLLLIILTCHCHSSLFILIFLLASTTLGVTLLTIPLHFIGLIV